MSSNTFSNVIAVAFLVLWVLAIVGMIIHMVRNKYGPTETVKAEVVDKYIEEKFSKYSGTGKHENYVIVFSAQGKKMSFYVSEFSYGGYQLNERGMLTYRGDQLIDFK